MYPRFDYGQCEDENFPPREEIPAKPSHTAGPQRGYFAFPLGWSSRFYIIEREVNRIKARRAAEAALSDDRTNEEEQQMRQCVLVEQTPRNEEATRRKRQHEELARQGEMEWVRSGMSLYDKMGRRDIVRTEMMRQEIRLQNEEQSLVERWKAYEDRWKLLLTSNNPLSFHDIPWPTQNALFDVHDLTLAAISDFLLASLRVRNNTVTKKERIRVSLLRWHPDKISSVWARVIKSDKEAVREGIGAVFTCLKTLQDEEKAS